MNQSTTKMSTYAINPDLQKKVAPILTNMVTNILMKKPQDPVSAVVKHPHPLISRTSLLQLKYAETNLPTAF